MFCSKCGQKLTNKEKFCSKCGQAVSDEVKGEASKGEPKKEEAVVRTTGEAPATPGAAPVKKQNPGAVCCGLLFLIIGLPAVIYLGFGSTLSNFLKVFVWIVIALVAVFLLYIIYEFIKAIVKKKTGNAILLGILILVIVVIGLAIYSYQKNKEVSSYGNLQDAFTSALAARYLGDDIIAGGSSADFATVKTQTAAASDALSKVSPPTGFSDYYNAIFDWSKKLNDAAASKKAWKTRPDAPTSFTTPVSGYMANNMFQASLDRIASTKDYGDLAIAKGDKDSMRYIGAELQVEDIALGDITISYSLPLGRLAEILVPSVQAKGPLKSPRGRCPDFGPCRGDLKKKLPSTYHPALRYSVGDPAAPAQWTNAWDDMLKTISIDNDYNVPGAGITNGSDPKAVSPMEQAFNDECHAKGGTTGGTGGVKDRLPITFSSGWNCNYPNVSQTCWDFLTTSGRRFMGGGGSCPEQGLLPKPPPVVDNSGGGGGGGTTTPTWSGTYHVTYTSMSCNIGISTGYSSMFNAAGFSDTIAVGGDSVKNFDGTTSQIDSSGNAIFVYNMNYAGSGGIKFTETYHFSGSSVSGKIYMVVNSYSADVTGNVTCSETFSGSK